jgi:ornithine--oxo-acid transaminase
MCLDEIQTGLGRTGEMFCHDHYDVEPDVLILGKALGGGIYPVSAVITSEENMSVFTPGSHGSTFGGCALGSAIGKVSLEVLVEEKMAEKAKENGAYFIGRLKEHARNNPEITDVRGKGLLIAVEFDKKVAHDYCLALMNEGLLAKDTHGSIIRFAPPLTITKEQIDEAMNKIRNVF